MNGWSGCNGICLYNPDIFRCICSKRDFFLVQCAYVIRVQTLYSRAGMDENKSGEGGGANDPNLKGEDGGPMTLI